MFFLLILSSRSLMDRTHRCGDLFLTKVNLNHKSESQIRCNRSSILRESVLFIEE